MLNLPENRIAVLDGAMGTMLQKKGLPLGKSPEALNLTHPEEIVSIHRAYAHAGAQILYANTFGANRRKLAGSGYEVRDVIAAGMRCVKEAARETGARAALCCGPIGALLEPNGSLHFDEAYDIFREVVTAGAEAGADLIVFETMTDLLEIKAALLAAKENTSLPVFCSMSFEPNGRTFTGVSVPAMAMTLEGLGADAVGINCSLGPEEILPFARELCAWTHLPVFIKPNAGLPNSIPMSTTFPRKNSAAQWRNISRSASRLWVAAAAQHPITSACWQSGAADSLWRSGRCGAARRCAVPAVW